MAELVDAPASGAGTRKGVEVRVLFWAPFIFLITQHKHSKTIEIYMIFRYMFLMPIHTVSLLPAKIWVTDWVTVQPA